MIAATQVLKCQRPSKSSVIFADGLVQLAKQFERHARR